MRSAQALRVYGLGFTGSGPKGFKCPIVDMIVVLLALGVVRQKVSLALYPCRGMLYPAFYDTM